MVNNYPSLIQLIPDSCITQEMCDKAVNICPFVIDFIPDQFKTGKMIRLFLKNLLC